jgi:hypothetical protein
LLDTTTAKRLQSLAISTVKHESHIRIFTLHGWSVKETHQ